MAKHSEKNAQKAKEKPTPYKKTRQSQKLLSRNHWISWNIEYFKQLDQKLFTAKVVLQRLKEVENLTLKSKPKRQQLKTVDEQRETITSKKDGTAKVNREN